MNKKDLIKEVSNVTCNRREAIEIVDTVIKSIQKGLLQDGHVQVGGLGSFTVKVRKARKGVHPRTGESLLIAPKRVIKFQPGTRLQAQLKQATEG